MHDFIFFSSTDWNGLWGSRQQIAQRLAQRGHRVLFVERPIGVEHWVKFPAFRHRLKTRRQQGVIEIEPNLWIYKLPVLVPGKYLSYLLNWCFQTLTIWLVKPIIRKLGFKQPILWLYNPENGNLVGRFDEKLAIYHCIDEWTANTSGRKKEIIDTLEKHLLSKVDVVFANSPPTYERKKVFNPICYRLASGVDYAHFSDGHLSATRFKIENKSGDYNDLPKPIIGYSGTINERLDYDLLSQAADAEPNWSFVLAGNPYPWTLNTQPLKTFLSLPNVFYVGCLTYQQMPHFLSSLDLCLIPYVLDARGYYRSPLKLYEYLAVGKPIVAVPTPENLEFSGIIGLGKTPESFIAAIKEQLFENSPEKQKARQAIAKSNDWNERIEMILNIIKSKLDSQND